METTTGERIEIKSERYFPPKEIEFLSPNKLRFSFGALEELSGGGSKMTVFLDKAGAEGSKGSKGKAGRCKPRGFIEYGGKTYLVESIGANFRKVLGRPAGLIDASAFVYEATYNGRKNIPYDISKTRKEICLTGCL